MSPTSREEMERYLQALDMAVEKRVADVPWEAMTHAERVFASVWVLEAEVNNGGYSQYFFNSSGEHAPDGPGALRSIGAIHAAQITQAALDVVGSRIPWLDGEKRQDAIGKLTPDQSEALDNLDTQFYTYPDDLTQLLFNYCTTHRNELPQAQG